MLEFLTIEILTSLSKVRFWILCTCSVQPWDQWNLPLQKTRDDGTPQAARDQVYHDLTRPCSGSGEWYGTHWSAKTQNDILQLRFKVSFIDLKLRMTLKHSDLFVRSHLWHRFLRKWWYIYDKVQSHVLLQSCVVTINFVTNHHVLQSYCSLYICDMCLFCLDRYFIKSEFQSRSFVWPILRTFDLSKSKNAEKYITSIPVVSR